MPAVLEVSELTTRFRTQGRVVHAVNGLSFSLGEGETLGIVGESGSGKSVSMLSIMRLVPQPPGRIEAGSVRFGGRDLLRVTETEMRRVRGRDIGMIFQDPMTSLNPVLTIGYQIGEALRLHLGMGERQARQRAAALLALVGLPNPGSRLNDHPHQFSGGMRQRVMIAMALACTPQVLIADEPTTALDVTIQAQIVMLVKRLQAELGMAVIWITHDLGIVARLAQRVLVMYAGYVVEAAPVRALFATPRHPYTLGLLQSLPRLHQPQASRLHAIPGQPPDLSRMPAGCPFAPRCGYAAARCLAENPPLEPVGAGHEAACWEMARLPEGGHRER
jgi:oligopeptide transport system ATP-binding protein